MVKTILYAMSLKVIDMQQLLIPIKEKAHNIAIEEAKQEAETTTINTLTAQIMAQQAHDQKGTKAETLVSQLLQ